MFARMGLCNYFGWALPAGWLLTEFPGKLASAAWGFGNMASINTSGILLTLGLAGKAAAAAGSLGLASSAALPLALVAAPVVFEQLAQHYKGRPEPEALAGLCRNALCTAVKTCARKRRAAGTPEGRDLELLELWEKGMDSAPEWTNLPDEEVPPMVLRLLRTESAAAVWRALKVVLERWTNLLEFLASPNWAAGTLGINVPWKPLELSAGLEKYLAAELPVAFAEEFRKHVTSGNQMAAFQQMQLLFDGQVVNRLEEIKRLLSLPEPLKPIRDFPRETHIRNDLGILKAHYRAVPFIGREADLQSLFQWLNGPGAFSFQVVCGRGGTGKTRLAYELLERLEAEQPGVWNAGVLENQRIPESLTPERFRKWRRERPTLIVIDYASAWTHLLEPIVQELYSAAGAAESDATPVRILLLERGANPEQGWYRSLRDRAQDLELELFPFAALHVNPLAADQCVQLLQEVFEALGRFGKRMGQPPRNPPTLPEKLAVRLAEKEMLDPLVIHMAALVAWDQGNLSALSLNRSDLARSVARREYMRIEKLATEGRTARILVHMAAYVCLTGRLTQAELEQACGEEMTRVGSGWHLPDLLPVVRDRALPAEGEGFAADPILPDIVAEAFTLQVLGEAGQDGQACVVRAGRQKLQAVVRTLVRMVQDFAPEAGQGDQAQKQALDLLVGLLTERAGVLSDADFWEIRFLLPESTTAMRESCRDFYRAFAGSRAEEEDQARLAAVECWAVYSGEMGLRQEAVELIGTMVPVRRKMAVADPAFLPALAGALNNLSNMQGEMGERAEALVSIRSEERRVGKECAM